MFIFKFCLVDELSQFLRKGEGTLLGRGRSYRPSRILLPRKLSRDRVLYRVHHFHRARKGISVVLSSKRGGSF